MRASKLEPLRMIGLALLHIVVVGALLWLAAYYVTQSKQVLRLYRYSLGSIPAYVFLDKLSRALDQQSGSVLLVGPSTVREGFDEALMNQTAPGFKFINAGVTSPGSMPHTELLVDII